MSTIKTFNFSKDDIEEIKAYEYGKNWPVVYVLKNSKEAYIGETTSLVSRTRQHLDNPDRSRFKNVHVITDEEYNVSATLDIESWLIQYMSTEGTFTLQNGNEGLRNHNYYDKEKYKAKFEVVWRDLQNLSLVQKDLVQIRNSDLFKFSPYKSLTEDQIIVAEDLYEKILKKETGSYIINGKPGTGKTILAIYLAKFLKEKKETKDLKIALVVPMVPLRKTLKKVFRKVKGLNSSMVIGPNDVGRDKFDVLIVDEAHRLKQRKNMANMGSFDATSKKLGLDKTATELDWILMQAKHRIFFYDKNQTIRPADILYEKMADIDAIKYDLANQHRVEAGEKYLEFIDDIFELRDAKMPTFSNYDFRLFDDIEKIVSEIKFQDQKHGLSRLVAGYAWEWKSKKDPKVHDIEIDRTKLFWNSTNQDWVNSKNAINEVGCIHTVQGYDLNYVGVIVGPELSYDKEKNRLVVNSDNYMDANGWRGISDPEELKRYIINIYKTLLTRGIKGTYVYVVDPNLREYFRDRMRNVVATDEKKSIKKEKIISPYAGVMVNLPLYESVGCGELMVANSIPEETISVRKSYLSGGSKYFVLRVTGDSMNKAGINDGDLVLCVKNYHPENGDNVVALIGDDATIKEYHNDGETVTLKPQSDNPKHQPLTFTDNEEMKVLGVVVRVLDSEK